MKKETLLKVRGRTNVNKLDKLLAMACVCFAVVALWISLGASLSGNSESFVGALKAFFAGLIFRLDAVEYGQVTAIAGFSAGIFYFALVFLIVGGVAVAKSGNKERLPGLFAAFVAFTGFSIALVFGNNMLQGPIHGFWPVSLIVLGVLELLVALFAIYYTLNTNMPIALEDDEEEAAPAPAPAPAPVEEKEEVKEEPAPAPAPVVFEKPEEEEEEAEEDEEEEEEEENPNDPFAALGKRKKRVPFENKVRRAKPEVRERYKTIVSALREYDFNDRKSIPGEAFSYKKERLIFLTFSGKTLKAYFRLDPQEFVDSPIPVKDASDVKKYEDTPAYLVIKSDLAARRVVSLAERIAGEHNVPKK